MAFNINDFLNIESKKEIKTDWKPVKVSIEKLRPAPDKANFYHADDKEVKELAESIELVGLQQYPVIRPVEGTDEYEVIAGHKRRLALLRLLAEGKTEYEMIPCKIEESDDIRNELILIFTNSTQRERTDYEKMKEIERVRELLEEYQKTHELPGRKQALIAELLGTSKTKVGTLDNINRNLNESFKQEFASGNISTSTANEIAGLEAEKQQELYEKYQETGTVQQKEVKSVKQDKPDPSPKEIEALYDWLEISLDDEITAENLKAKHGKTHTGGGYKGFNVTCTPHGVQVNRSKEMTWGKIAKAFQEIRKEKQEESSPRQEPPEETPDYEKEAEPEEYDLSDIAKDLNAVWTTLAKTQGPAEEILRRTLNMLAKIIAKTENEIRRREEP